jgi:hypothetical protein
MSDDDALWVMALVSVIVIGAINVAAGGRRVRR